MARRKFNEDGVHAVALYRLAAMLGISQGNLTYHFKTKVDLAIELADAFEDELGEAAHPIGDGLGADRVLAHLEQVLVVLWRYRFLLAAPNYLATVDAKLEARYRQVHRNMRTLIRANTTALVETGAMRAPRQGAGEIIADNIVAVWLAWLQVHGFSDGAQPDVPTRAMLMDCFEHHFGLLEPYVSTAFVIALNRALAAQGEWVGVSLPT